MSENSQKTNALPKMQTESTTPSLSWLYDALRLVASFIAGTGLATLITTWLNRKKPSAEVERIAAETRKIHIESDIEISQSVARSIVRLERMQAQVDDLRLTIAQRDTELKLAHGFISKQRALLELHGIKFSEFDERKDSKGNLT